MDLKPKIRVKIIGLQGEELPPGQYTAEITNTRELTGGKYDGDLHVRARLISPTPYPEQECQ